MSNIYDLSIFLEPQEKILWQGMPQAVGSSPWSLKIIQAFGYFGLFAFGFFLLIGLANWDEIGEALGIWLIFLGLSLAIAFTFLVVMPKVVRSSLKATHYIVTPTHAVIVQHLWQIQISRIPVPENEEIVIYRDQNFQTVRFYHYDNRAANPENRVYRVYQFERLTPHDAATAAKVLETIRGQAGPGAQPVFSSRPKPA
ncbi:hypothetical protein AWQ21_07205 [Picosynechococcus sp. PCC 7003]|uniref:hypothetical protein n=1 Tax=Picosynechococcus sp. PCC 7003 TaxID=374981 RepID=UPI000810E02F|nr:hypothetical protein [Picosynechococcus sp. PCC 7003]ANV84182.1 hypothetical protein AWQ21_07205 [Picosynechococcus sp. PCC 7003]